MLSTGDIGTVLPIQNMTWNELDVILYALGVGAGIDDDLELVYEGAGLLVLPTFAVIPTFPAFSALGQVLDFDHHMTLHGRQRIVLDAPLPPAASVVTTGTVDQIWDKGAAAVIVAKSETRLSDGQRLITAESTAFVRNGGGFGGNRGPAASRWEPPQRTPDCEVATTTSPDQALLYRLSGDRNPLHADPEVAAKAGFARPILHGLCTYGVVGRIALKALADGDPARFRSMDARFSGVVYPGETLVSRFWNEPDGIRFVTKVAERDALVLDEGTVEIGPRT